MASRWLAWVVLLAATLQSAGIARTDLPAQDGLKFIRAAQAFQQESWTDAVRGTDQHPLYPALIALVQPLLALIAGPSSDSWRLAAQGVASFCNISLIIPLFLIARRFFDERVGLIAAWLWVLLPFPAEIGRDTLSDSIALFAFTAALALGLRAFAEGTTRTALATGLVAGLGFLARPEVALLPVAILGAVGLRSAWSLGHRIPLDQGSRRSALGRSSALLMAFLAVVGAYALVKGEVSEKLAVRQAIAIGVTDTTPGLPNRGLPPGLDDPYWDFAPKEESGAVGRLSLLEALRRVTVGWAEAMGWLPAALAILGVFRVRANKGRVFISVYVVLFSAALIRHGMALGYISGRHTLSLVVVALPWASAQILMIGQRIKRWLHLNETRSRRLVGLGLAMAIVLGACLQIRESHPSRWGHGEAGRWLAKHAEPNMAILDTRGWASFVRGGRSYDYWHVRQAISDASLRYLVVGADELNAKSRRAETLRAILAFACEPAAAFPARRGGSEPGVLVFRYQRPDSWEGIAP